MLPGAQAGGLYELTDATCCGMVVMTVSAINSVICELCLSVRFGRVADLSAAAFDYCPWLE